jgi:hypothetical protein
MLYSYIGKETDIYYENHMIYTNIFWENKDMFDGQAGEYRDVLDQKFSLSYSAPNGQLSPTTHVNGEYKSGLCALETF